MDNNTLKIDQATHDLVLLEDGGLAVITGDDTSAQCVRLTLETFKDTFFLDLDHGTDYDRIMGQQVDIAEADAILREAIYQEQAVQYIDELTIRQDGRTIISNFAGRLKSGAAISAEVQA